MESGDFPSSNSIQWLEKDCYLILYRGIAFHWNALTLDINFCSGLSNFRTNPDLLWIDRICVSSSLVFAVYKWVLTSWT